MRDPSFFLANLASRMTLEEKVGQLNLLTGAMDATGMKRSDDLEAKIREGRCGAVFNVFTPSATRALQEVAMESRLRIPLIFGYDVIHGHRTIFPIPLALSCTWNPNLVEACARAAGAEAAADGLHWVFSPMVDISQDARWGRVAEGAGEDPWLGSRMAEAMVRGYQMDDLANPDSVACCVKHFALYGAAIAGRDYHTVDMSLRTMLETYFPPYQAAIQAGARTVMTAFNEIDGIPASGNAWLLKEWLRNTWGFDGLVVTDYTAVSEMKNHGTAASEAEAAKQALAAGVDMDMVSECFLTELPAIVRSGEVSESWIDAAVMRVLKLKWDLGLFQDPFNRCDDEKAKQVLLHPGTRQLARQAARESMVLLKNDAALLPVKKHGRIAVIGPLADSARDMLGCWCAAGQASDAVTPLDGIRNACGGINAPVDFARGCEIHHSNKSLTAEAVELAAAADVVILILGENHQMNGEAASRCDIRLPKCQRKLAKRIHRTGTPCILVTLSGRPLELTREAERFSTMLHAWTPGTEGGNALADVIFGDFAPVGKLTMAFPRHVGQLPMTYREKPSGRPCLETEKYTSKYLDVPNSPLFPFGHGLTYGVFKYGAPVVEIRPDGSACIQVEIINLSKHPATETIQLYFRDPVASVTRPVKELRGYQRVTLRAGESRKLRFSLNRKDLALIGKDGVECFESGEFIAMTGPDSETLQSASFSLE
jgi:beta-glucosidase